MKIQDALSLDDKLCQRLRILAALKVGALEKGLGHNAQELGTVICTVCHIN